MYLRYLMVIACLTIVLPGVAEAKKHGVKRHHYGLICGKIARRDHGLMGNEWRSLNLALEWARRFPHTSAQPGAVVVQRRKGLDAAGNPGGHVSTIVKVLDADWAIVKDEKGQYKRNIRQNLVAYVKP